MSGVRTDGCQSGPHIANRIILRGRTKKRACFFFNTDWLNTDGLGTTHSRYYPQLPLHIAGDKVWCFCHHSPAGAAASTQHGDWTAEVIGFTRNVTGSGPGLLLLLLTDFHLIICAVFWIWEVWEVVGSREQYSGAVLYCTVLCTTPGHRTKLTENCQSAPTSARPPCDNTTLHWGCLIIHTSQMSFNILYSIRTIWV